MQRTNDRKMLVKYWPCTLLFPAFSIFSRSFYILHLLEKWPKTGTWLPTQGRRVLFSPELSMLLHWFPNDYFNNGFCPKKLAWCSLSVCFCCSAAHLFFSFSLFPSFSTSGRTFYYCCCSRYARGMGTSEGVTPHHGSPVASASWRLRWPFLFCYPAAYMEFSYLFLDRLKSTRFCNKIHFQPVPYFGRVPLLIPCCYWTCFVLFLYST